MSTSDTSPSTSPPPAAETLPNTRAFWRLALAAITPIPPLAITVATLLAPYPMSGEFADILTGVAAEPGRMQAGLWFSLLAALTIVPATIVVAWTCAHRTPKLTTLAGTLAVAGFSAAILLPNDELTALAAAQKSLDRDTMLTLNEATWQQPTVLATLAVFLLGMVVGGVLLGIALWRSRTTPQWTALALIVGSVLHLAPALANNVVTALSWALTAVGYTAASRALLRAGHK